MLLRLSKGSMKNIFIGFVTAVLLALASYGGYRAYQDHKLVIATATYLFAETEIKRQDGKPLTRADLIDAVLKDAVQRAQAPAPGSPVPVK